MSYGVLISYPDLPMECLFLRETGADELDKQLSFEQNHGCSSRHETLLPHEKYKTEYSAEHFEMPSSCRSAVSLLPEEYSFGMASVIIGTLSIHAYTRWKLTNRRGYLRGRQPWLPKMQVNKCSSR